MGGEKVGLVLAPAPTWGSPPHGRGKALTRPRRPRLAGITPAWAGKRHCFHSSHNLYRDHPRMGGEKYWRH